MKVFPTFSCLKSRSTPHNLEELTIQRQAFRGEICFTWQGSQRFSFQDLKGGALAITI
jgi:hypothetical protein